MSGRPSGWFDIRKALRLVWHLEGPLAGLTSGRPSGWFDVRKGFWLV